MAYFFVVKNLSKIAHVHHLTASRTLKKVVCLAPSCVVNSFSRDALGWIGDFAHLVAQSMTKKKTPPHNKAAVSRVHHPANIPQIDNANPKPNKENPAHGLYFTIWLSDEDA